MTNADVPSSSLEDDDEEDAVDDVEDDVGDFPAESSFCAEDCCRAL